MNNMPEIIIMNNEYADGKRIAVQQITYNKSEDVRELGHLQHQLSNILEQLEKANENTSFEYLRGEKKRLENEIAVKQSFVDDYPEEE